MMVEQVTSSEAADVSLEELERRLMEGKDVTVQLKSDHTVSSAITSQTPQLLQHSTAKEPSSLDLLEETERLLARMTAMKGTPEEGRSMTTTPTHLSEAALNASTAENEASESSELNDMLGKAAMLSNMMKSMSQMPPDNSVASMGLNGMSRSSAHVRTNASVASSRRDPDGSIVGERKRVEPTSSPAPGLTETTSDDTSSHHDPQRRSSDQKHHLDPPGDCNSLTGKRKSQDPEASATSGLSLPAALVHLNSLEDDVSSVGSESLRTSTNNKSPDSHARTTLLSVVTPPPVNGLSADKSSVSPVQENSPLGGLENENNEKPLNAPSPSKYSDVVDSSSPRNSSADGVTWEKVSTAHDGDDDFVPLVDYSHVQPTKNSAVKPVVTPRSRMEELRKRNKQRQKRRFPAAVVVTLLGAIAFMYCKFAAPNEIVVEVVEEEEVLDLWMSYDTALISLHATGEGYSLEARQVEGPIAAFAFKPVPVEVPEEPEPPKRGFFGRLKK